MTYLTESRDALAKALRKTRMTAYPDGKDGHLFRGSTPEEQADALIASGAVIPADTLADDAEFRRRLRQACNDPGSYVERHRAIPGGPLVAESMTDWQDRALAAALTERSGMSQSAENDVLVCRHCGEPIRQRGGAWEHYPTGPNARRRGWQGRRCPGRITGAEPRPLAERGENRGE